MNIILIYSIISCRPKLRKDILLYLAYVGGPKVCKGNKFG